jgi:hypothetical protein
VELGVPEMDLHRSMSVQTCGLGERHPPSNRRLRPQGKRPLKSFRLCPRLNGTFTKSGFPSIGSTTLPR